MSRTIAASSDHVTRDSAAPWTVPALLRARAAADPNRVALELTGPADNGQVAGAAAMDDPRERASRRQLTYRQWDERSGHVAAALQHRGVRPGEPVALVFGPSDWLGFAVAYCGVQKAGGVPAPMGNHLGDSSIDELTADVAGVIVGPDAQRAGLPAGHHGSAPGRTASWRASMAELDRPERQPEDVPISATDPAQILYTSGTTGRPKGVLASHANLTFGLDPAPRRRPLAHSAHCLHAFALGSNAGQAMLISALVAAPTTLIVPAFDADSFGTAIERYRVGSVFVVPAMAAELVSRRVPQRYDMSSVVLFGSTSAALPPAVARSLASALPRATLVNCYTSTEAAPAQLTMVFDEERADAVGRPERPGDLRITGPDGTPVPPGEPGEVWLRSPAPARSYYGRAARGASGQQAGWVAMGDVGYQDQDGYLYLLDRADDVVKSGGLKVSTLRVEAMLHEHPAVADASVLGVPHPTLGQVTAAMVVLAPGHETVTEADLRGFLAVRLGRAEVPSVIKQAASLPRNAAGKVLKRQLRDELALGGHRAGPTPRSAAEVMLARLWARLLGEPPASTADDFFALGGDSMLAAQLSTLATEAFGRAVPSAFAYDHPGLADQAAWVDAALPAGPGSAPGSAQRIGADATPAESCLRQELSSLQEQLLTWMHETEPPRDSGAVQLAVRVHDDVDPVLMREAVADLVMRHEALRTRFTRSGGSWIGELSADSAAEVIITDVAGQDRRERAADLLLRQVRQPLDWRTGPLVRLILIRTDPEEYLLALVVHHLVADGWSMGILLRELGLTYSGRRTGRTAALPPATQASEVVRWSRRQWPASRPRWQSALHGAPAWVEPFPGRRSARNYVAVSQLAGLDDGLSAAVRAAAAADRVSPFVLVAACWLAVLARHTGAAEFVVLTPVTGRPRPEFESAIGCLAQSLLVRVRVADDPPLRTLAVRLRDGLLAATDRQAYPLAEFGTAIPYPVEIPFSRWPSGPHIPGLVSEPLDLPHGVVWRWPLPGEDFGVPKLEIAELPGGRLETRFTYNQQAFAARTIAELSDRFLAVVTLATDHRDERLSHLTGTPSQAPTTARRTSPW